MLIPASRCRRRSLAYAAVITFGLGCAEEDPGAEDEPAPPPADEGCRVVTCPEGVESCCAETFAAVSGTAVTDYARRDDLIDGFTKSVESIRLDVTFDAPEQSAVIVFNLGTQRSFYSMQVTAARGGASNAFVSAVVSDPIGRGCIYGADLPAAGGEGPPTTPLEIGLTSDEFCFNGGLPGRGNVIEFGLRATGPGAASLEIVDLELRSVGTID